MCLEVRWLPRARKDLKRLDRPVQRDVIEAVEPYAQTGQGDVTRMVNVTPPEYRLRVGDWRVRFSRNPAHGWLEVLRVRHRRDAYRRR